MSFTHPREIGVIDTEVYKDYFLLSVLIPRTGAIHEFEMYPGHLFACTEAKDLLRSLRVVSFNGIGFDMPIIGQAIRGDGCRTLKRIADDIIVGGKKPWELDATPFACDHIDLIEVAPGMASLKIYGGRMHSPKLQDLPIEPDASIRPEAREVLRRYCVNDLKTTLDLYNKLLPQIELRERMSDHYNTDLRSKSDAQIAETVISSGVANMRGEAVTRPRIAPGTTFMYQVPTFIKFKTQALHDILLLVKRSEFIVPESGKVVMPTELAKASIRIGKSVYKMGIGGLHSTEKNASHYASDDVVLIDRDVASYYPAIILRLGLMPGQMGEHFLSVYSQIVQRRLEAKRLKDTVTADALKITINGSFGKFGSKWSRLYSPPLLIQTTITGQLCLLMLIEALEEAGIPVVSANTDGVVMACPTSRLNALGAAVADWESKTGFDTEETRYAALHSRDVNNYVAIKTDGSVKLKGAYAKPGLMKNPTNEVCIDAVLAFLKDYTPLEETILACTDITKFVTVRQVNGGALDQQQRFFGKAVRWYYGRGIVGPIRYKKNGYTVARSEGARVIMDLPTIFPDDIDYDWYVTEAKSILGDIDVEPIHYQSKDIV